MARSVRLLTSSALATMLVFAGAPSALADDRAVTQTKETQAAMTPDKALELLKQGNARFVRGEKLDRDLGAQVKTTRAGQYPHSVVLGSIDSRVPPEIIFDQGVGDIFVPRVAGNFVNVDILGSMEFAAAVAGSKLIVVLGHTDCGAVKGACDNVELGNLTHTLSNIAPAVYSVTGVEGERSSANKDFVRAVTLENVRLTVQNVLERSFVLRELAEKKKLRVVGAMYDVKTGEVTFLE